MAKPIIFKNIIWHLFAGESHQVVKITVTSCGYELFCIRIQAFSQLMPGPDLSINEKKIITVDKKVRQADKIPWQCYNVYFL
jgi:hypothetical protein